MKCFFFVSSENGACSVLIGISSSVIYYCRVNMAIVIKTLGNVSEVSYDLQKNIHQLFEKLVH